MRENVTFVFKSFERQRLAKHLYKNIQHYYPGINVIIIDDSSKPLELTGPGLRVVQLPFNSGLSKGLNKGLELVQTPFVVRMDDDELLTPYSNFHEQLEFLHQHGKCSKTTNHSTWNGNRCQSCGARQSS